METRIFHFLILISALCIVRSQELPFIKRISVYEILPVPTECPKFENPNENVHIAHEWDCSAFYQCSHGEKKIKYCQTGLHFNPKLQICDYKWSAGCIPTGNTETTSTTTPKPTTTTPEPTTTTPKPTTTTPEPTTTTPKPTTTTTTTTTTTPKPSTTTPEPTTTTTTTTTTPKPTTTTPEPTTTTTTTTQKTTTTTPEPTTTTTISTTPESSYPTSCPKVDPAELIYLPHECVCSKYYTCKNGLQILQECLTGLAFDPRSHRCDWPSVGGCITTPQTPTPNPGPTPPTTDPNSTAVVPTECPKTNDGEVVHLAHETDCSSFYKCDSGRKVRLECPSGLHFNPVKQVCDWPENAKCASSLFWTR